MIEDYVIVDLEGWRYVENIPEQRKQITQEERYEFALNRELYSANKGVSLSFAESYKK